MMRIATVLILIAFPTFVFGQPTENELVPTDDHPLVHVKTSKMDGTPREGEVIVFKNTTTNEAEEVVTNAEGKSDILLKEGNHYKIYSKLLNDQQQVSELEVPVMDGPLVFTITLQWDQSNREIKLDNIHFDSGKATLRKSSMPTLDDVILLLQRKPQMRIQIQGHTDSDGTEVNNQALSEARATTVKQYLIDKGIAADRLESLGFGESKPVAENNTAEGKQQNRRTVIKILSE